MLVILFAVTGLCIWDGINTKQVINTMKEESQEICAILTYTDISDKALQKKINDLNDYWTDEMDILCISISRKDLQPVSDYLQYLCASIINNNQEDAITYSRLLNYNLIGLSQSSGLEMINLL